MAKNTKATDQAPHDSADIASLSYEQAIERMEGLIDQIESGELGLEESCAAYEHAAKLRDHCQSILDRVEQRVEKLTQPSESKDAE